MRPVWWEFAGVSKFPRWCVCVCVRVPWCLIGLFSVTAQCQKRRNLRATLNETTSLAVHDSKDFSFFSFFFSFLFRSDSTVIELQFKSSNSLVYQLRTSGFTRLWCSALRCFKPRLLREQINVNFHLL